jgi:hypothetical protein
MIDWYLAGFSASWIFGLSLVVAALSFAYYLAIEEKRRFREALISYPVRILIDLGLFFFCLGWTGNSSRAWERVIWAILALIFAVRTLQDRKQRKE